MDSGPVIGEVAVAGGMWGAVEARWEKGMEAEETQRSVESVNSGYGLGEAVLVAGYQSEICF